MKKILLVLAIFASITTFAERAPKLHTKIIGRDYIYLAEDIYNKDEVYNKNSVYNKPEIDELLKRIKPQAAIATNRYPLFCIELNTDILNYTITKTSGNVTDVSLDESDRYSMSDWNAFELKGSTNNFLNVALAATLNITNNKGVIIKTINYNLPGLTESKKLLYWACSEFSTTPYESSDTMRKYVTEVHADKVYYDHDHDPRTWYFFDSVTQLTNKHPNRVMVLLDPATFKHVSDNAWCHDHNEDLVWSYKRLKGSTEEKDDNGNTVWRPILPIKWYSQMPSWAYTNKEVRVISEKEYLKYK